MPHRSPYQRIRRRAVLSESIFQLLKSTHSIGSTPLGGLISLAINAHNCWLPQLFLQPTRGGRIWTLAHRNSSVAVRAGRVLWRGISTLMVAALGRLAKRTQSFCSEASHRQCYARRIKPKIE